MGSNWNWCIDVYIPHRKYQAKPQSSLWFLAACATKSKVKFRQASNNSKRVLEAAKLAYTTKKEYITFQKRSSQYLANC